MTMMTSKMSAVALLVLALGVDCLSQESAAVAGPVVDMQMLQLVANASRAIDFTIEVELKRRAFGPGAAKTVSDHTTYAQGKLSSMISTTQNRFSSDLSVSTTVTGAVGVKAGSGGTDEAFIFLMVDGLALGSVTNPVKTALESDYTTIGAGWNFAQMQTPAYVSGDSSSGMGADQAASGKGDPHLVNMNGQRFDLFQPGVHTLLQVPRHAAPKDTLLQVAADAKRLGGACADLYFQVLTISGNWSQQAEGLQFFAQHEPSTMEWRKFGAVDLKVVHGHTGEGIAYLNVFVKHLKSVPFAVGGLLGEDDHMAAATPGKECSTAVDLHAQGLATTAASSLAIIED